MQEETGRIIHFGKENEPVRGCTISKQVYQDGEMAIYIFSMAAGTDISAESYEYHKILTVYSGTLEVFTSTGIRKLLKAGESIVTELNIPVGMQTEEGCVYTEIGLRKESKMNELLKAGEVLKLGDLLPYQEKRIVNMDLIKDPKLKFVIMSFDTGTGLTEHSAPGEALIFALDGEGVIGYEGKEHVIKAGETFKFDKMGKHWVKAEKRFKMALLLVLE